MKKLNLVLFFALSSLFISCDKDDSEPIVIDETLLVGEWNLVGFETKDGRSSTEFQGQTIETNYTSYGKDFDVQVTFAENPNTLTSAGSYTTVLETSVLGQSQTQVVPGTPFSLVGEWSIDGNKLTTSANGQEAVTEILTLTEEKLVMQTTLNQTIEEQGLLVTTTGIVLQTLERK